MQQATYSPAIFNVGSIDQAKRIILTPEGDLTTEHRWQTETPYLLAQLEQTIALTEKSIVLDYGCGIGRMAKALIDKYGCRVVGTDISPSMRALAAAYVASERFFVCDPAALYWLNVRFDAALAIWVLQHCHQVEEDIGRVRRALVLGGKLFVVNDQRRIVPTVEMKWVNDGQDVRAMLGKAFQECWSAPLNTEAMGEVVAQVSFMAAFELK